MRGLYINRCYEFKEDLSFGRTRGNLKIALLAASQDNMAQMHNHMVEKFREEQVRTNSISGSLSLLIQILHVKRGV